MKGFIPDKNCDKWGKPIPQGCSRIFPMWLADMDIPLYPEFHKALKERFCELNNCTYKQRSQSYYNALISWYHMEHACSLERKHFVMAPSICHLYASCVLAFTKPEKQAVLVMTPVYDFFAKSAKALDRKVVELRLSFEPNNDAVTSRLHINFKKLEQTLDSNPHIKMIAFCNPHNPSGRIWDEKQSSTIVKLAQKRGIYIFSDEIMCDLRHDHKRDSFVTLAKSNYEKIIIGNSISKAFNLQSIQGGYGIVKSEKVKARLQQITLRGLKLLVNQTAIFLTQIVYTDSGRKWFRDICGVIRTNFQKLLQFKKKFLPKLVIFDLDSTYVVLVDFNHYCRSESELVKRLESHGIYFNILSNYFQPRMETTMARISIAIDPESFEEFLSVLRKCFSVESSL